MTAASWRKLPPHLRPYRPQVAPALDQAFLVLDGPSSALGMDTATPVTESIGRLTGRRTNFVIAHRLSTVRSCDLILMLRDGVVVVEQGGSADLTRRSGGAFAQLYDTRSLGKEEKSIGVS